MSIRSKDAKQLLNNPLLQDAFANVRESLVQQIEECPLDETVLNNQLMLCLQLLRGVINDIKYQIELEE